MSGDIDERLLSSAALARIGDPAGTRLFVELLTDLGNDCSPFTRRLGMTRVETRFPSLGRETSWTWNEDASRGWRTWLEIREHEGFRPDAQAARDEAAERG